METYTDSNGTTWEIENGQIIGRASESQADIERSREAGRMAAEDVGTGEAMMIGAGKTFTNVLETLGLRDVGGAEKAYYQELSKDQPIATGVGEVLPKAYYPGGPLAQVAGGAVGGLLTTPEAPVTGAALEAGGALAGEVVGRVLARAIKGRALVKPTSKQSRQFTELGGEITPGQAFEQASGAQKLRTPIGSRSAEAALESAPISGGRIAAMKGRNQETVNRLAARSIGEDADKLTPDVLDNAYRRLGKEFDAAEDIVTDMVPPEGFVDNLDILPPRTRKAAIAEIEASGQLSGKRLSQVRESARKMLRSPDPEKRIMAEELLDDYFAMVDTAMTPGEKAAFRQTREQYKNLMALESTGVAVEPGGNVNYRSLFNKLSKSYGRRGVPNALPETQDLYEFTRLAGSREFMDVVGNSGTATRQSLFNPLAFGGGALGIGYLTPQRGILDPLAASAGRLGAGQAASE